MMIMFFQISNCADLKRGTRLWLRRFSAISNIFTVCLHALLLLLLNRYPQLAKQAAAASLQCNLAAVRVFCFHGEPTWKRSIEETSTPLCCLLCNTPHPVCLIILSMGGPSLVGDDMSLECEECCADIIIIIINLSELVLLSSQSSFCFVASHISTGQHTVSDHRPPPFTLGSQLRVDCEKSI